MRIAASIAAAIAIAITSTTARADVAACTGAAEEGQRARAAGRLVGARKQFVTCSNAFECPGLVQRDCAKWAAEVLDATPTIVIDARDEAGHDISDAVVTIDGASIPGGMNGKAIDIDPGNHTILITRKSGAQLSESIIAKEGVKRRPLRVTFKTEGPETANGATTASSEPRQPPAAEKPAQVAQHSVAPWVLVGVGAAMMVVGVVLIATTGDLPAGCTASGGECAPLPGETPAQSPPTAKSEADQAALDQRRSHAGNIIAQPKIGVGFVVSGGVLAAGGLLWHFLEPTTPVAASSTTKYTHGFAGIAPWFDRTTGGLVTHGTF